MVFKVCRTYDGDSMAVMKLKFRLEDLRIGSYPNALNLNKEIII